MRKIFQKNLLTENNQYSKYSNNGRPITTNANLKKETPIKLFNKRTVNSNIDKYNSNNSTNYSFFKNGNRTYNKHRFLNKKQKNLSEGELNTASIHRMLPLISQTERNHEIKINKKKIEDIINMFRTDPENKSFLQKKLKFNHR